MYEFVETHAGMLFHLFVDNAKIPLFIVGYKLSEVIRDKWKDSQIHLEYHGFFTEIDRYEQFVNYTWEGRNNFKTYTIRTYHNALVKFYREYALMLVSRKVRSSRLMKFKFMGHDNFSLQLSVCLNDAQLKLERGLYKSEIPKPLLDKYILLNNVVRKIYEEHQKATLLRKDVTKKAKIQHLLQGLYMSLIFLRDVIISQDDLNGDYVGLQYTYNNTLYINEYSHARNEAVQELVESYKTYHLGE